MRDEDPEPDEAEIARRVHRRLCDLVGLAANKGALPDDGVEEDEAEEDDAVIENQTEAKSEADEPEPNGE